MKLTNKHNLPKPFLDAVSRDYTYKPKRYSVTQILQGTRQAILTRRHNDEIVQDVADMVWAIFGSAVHKILENAQESDTQLKENWVSWTAPNGYTLSGIFDLYDDATGTVVDYKTASVWKAVFEDWSDYRKQTLMYCFMLRKMGFNANRGRVVAMLKDHSKSKAKFDSAYPQVPLAEREWEFSEKDFADIENEIITRLQELEAAEKLPDEKLPMCSEEERWTKPAKWAVKKKGAKRALKLHDCEEAAKSQLEQLGKGHEIEYRPGADSRCEAYCSVCEFCEYYKEKYHDLRKAE